MLWMLQSGLCAPVKTGAWDLANLLHSCRYILCRISSSTASHSMVSFTSYMHFFMKFFSCHLGFKLAKEKLQL
jgi:hypothetical protein